MAPAHRTFPPLALVALVALSTACAEPERPGIPALHVMLVTAAGVRADHTSAYLYHRPTTLIEFDGGMRRLGRALSLDDLAAEGVLFADAFAPSNGTLPSLAALHTGRSPLATGVFLDEEAPALEETTLAEALAEAGFRTLAFVSRAGAPLAPGWRQGFDVFEQGANDSAALGAALRWAGEHDFGNGRGVFVWIHLAEPTFPFEPVSMPRRDGPPIDFARLYTDPGYAGAADGSAAFRDTHPVLDERDREQVVALYDGELALLTHRLTFFLDYFHWVTQPAGAWPRTLFVFAGTGGLELFRDGRSYGHSDSLHDSVLRVPFFLRHPDSLTGRRVLAELVELQDLMPTLLDRMELTAPPVVEGRSLLPLTDFYVRRPFERRPAFAVLGGGKAYSVRTADWRLVLRVSPDGEVSRELYHVSVDPNARDDVAPEHEALAAALEEELRAWSRGE